VLTGSRRTYCVGVGIHKIFLGRLINGDADCRANAAN
jgi:hypothetical protein